jgi:hypothetical protein
MADEVIHLLKRGTVLFVLYISEHISEHAKNLLKKARCSDARYSGG